MDKKQAVAIVFILLMLGSSIGAMVSTFINNTDSDINIPSERILTYKLSELQKRELLNRGFTLVEYDYPEACLSCEQQKNLVEGWVLQSDNQIYLQEGFSSGTITGVQIDSFKGSESLTDPANEEIKTALCELMAQRAFWCVEILA
jgi:hypothetical protein